MWSLTWLLGFAAIAGVAIDSSNGYRNKAMLQSTADVAALAGAWDLPEGFKEITSEDAYDFTGIHANAVKYADLNMNMDPGTTEPYYGNYLKETDVTIGHWDNGTRTFIPASADSTLIVNAVAAQAFQNEEENRGAGVATTLLHMVGMRTWDIRTQAVAMIGVNECYHNGVVARETLALKPGSEILSKACLHGQKEVNVRPNQQWNFPEALSVGNSPNEVTEDGWRVSNNNQYDSEGNPVDMSEPNRKNMYPPMVDYIPTIGRHMLLSTPEYRHFVYPEIDYLADEQHEIVILPDGFSTVLGTFDPDTTESGASSFAPPSDFAASGGVQVASLDGFASLAAFLGFSAQPTTTEEWSSDQMSGDSWTYNDEEVRQQGQQWKWPGDTPAYIDPEAMKERGMPYDDTLITGTQAALPEDRVYFVPKCGPENKLVLRGDIRRITIVTNCKLSIGEGAEVVLADTVLLTTVTKEYNQNGDDGAATIHDGSQIGGACGDSGGARIFANGDLGASANSLFIGSQLVVRDDVHFAAKSDSSKGLSILAGGDVTITANARIGSVDYSDGKNPWGSCPDDGIGEPAFDEAAHEVSLVR